MSVSLVICFAFAVVSLDPSISSTYTWSSTSFAASGNSVCDNFARLLIALVAMSGAGLSPKFNLKHFFFFFFFFFFCIFFYLHCKGSYKHGT